MTRLAAYGFTTVALIALSVAGAAASAQAGDISFQPTATPDWYTTQQDTYLYVDAAGGILANDSSNGNGPLEMDGISAGPEGDVSHGADGHFSFQPAPGFVGTAVFQYRNIAGGWQSEYSTLTIEVTAAPAPAPVANPDSYETVKNVPLVVDAASGLLVNDVSASTVNGIDDSGVEWAVDEDGSFTYTPVTDFVGTRVFHYTMTDGALMSNVAAVTITVTEPAVIPDDPGDPETPDTPDTPESTVPGTPQSTTPQTPVVLDPAGVGTLASTGGVTGWLAVPALALLIAGCSGLLFAARKRRAILR